MTFECDGTRYDTCEMDRIDTDALRGPAVYITRDVGRVFVQTWDSWEGVLIHRADVVEIERLWHTYRAAPLLPVLALIGRAPVGRESGASPQGV